MISVNKISDQVYTLMDQANYGTNLVIGSKKALVFDTGAGIDNMYQAIRNLTSLPLLVINSHGHFDHIGGNYQFDTVYMEKEDFVLQENYTLEVCSDWIHRLEPYRDIEQLPRGFGSWKNTKQLDFKEFSLGNLEGTIFPLPGHSKGSIGVYIPQLELLLSGDALTPVMCMNFGNHTSLEVQKQTLERVQTLNFKWFLTSHYTKAFPKEIIAKMLECLEKCKEGRWHEYKYPYPPYTNGRLYLESMGAEPVALIVDEKEYLQIKQKIE